MNLLSHWDDKIKISLCYNILYTSLLSIILVHFCYFRVKDANYHSFMQMNEKCSFLLGLSLFIKVNKFNACFSLNKVFLDILQTLYTRFCNASR